MREGHKTQESSSIPTPCLSPPSSKRKSSKGRKGKHLRVFKAGGGSPAGIPGSPQNLAFLLSVQSRKLICSEQQSPHHDHSSTCTSDHHPLGKYTGNQIVKIDRLSSVPPSAQKPGSPRSNRSSGSRYRSPQRCRPGRPQPAPNSLAGSKSRDWRSESTWGNKFSTAHDSRLRPPGRRGRGGGG